MLMPITLYKINYVISNRWWRFEPTSVFCHFIMKQLSVLLVGHCFKTERSATLKQRGLVNERYLGIS